MELDVIYYFDINSSDPPKGFIITKDILDVIIGDSNI
jgi:hypothetical protein